MISERHTTTTTTNSKKQKYQCIKICRNCKNALVYFVEYCSAPLCNSINLEIRRIWKELTKSLLRKFHK